MQKFPNFTVWVRTVWDWDPYPHLLWLQKPVSWVTQGLIKLTVETDHHRKQGLLDMLKEHSGPLVVFGISSITCDRGF